ncbi:hypothetical protein ACHQM5_012808 [Ranunculus cassubicifolius]
MLNRVRIFSMYCSCDSHNFPCPLSRVICIPRICRAWPRSFISKDLANSAFNFEMRSLLCPTISMSSTYNSSTIKSSGENL